MTHFVGARLSRPLGLLYTDEHGTKTRNEAVSNHTRAQSEKEIDR